MIPKKLIWLVTLLAFLDTCYSKNYSDYRLPNNHIPKKYVLQLTIDPNATGFSGEVKIGFSTQNKTNSIDLHASATHMIINEVTLNGQYPCNVSSVDNETDIAHIICDQSIEGDNNEVYLKFNGLYADFGVGLYKEEYKYNTQTEYTVASQFEATDARKAFPCFDEPELKAEFDITVIHPLNYTALSNSPIINETIEESSIVVTFKTTPIMSTYLIAFHISKDSRKQTSASEDPDAYPITLNYKPYLDEFTGTAQKYSGILLHAHSVFTGIPYDNLGITKMDFAGISGFGGAMENWGLVIFDDEALLDEGNDTTPEHEQYIIRTIAHELAHQWFGDYVTLNWWSDVWLNEAFARFFDNHYDEKFVGTAMDLERQFTVGYVQSALDYDQNAKFPISNKDEEIYIPDVINVDKFDTISYDKGATIVRMMRGILGHENFQKGLQKYLQENGHKNTKASTLLNTLGTVYDNPDNSFEELLHNWIYVRGYPLVNVTLNADGETVQIKQEVFTENAQWHVPISYTTSKEQNFSIRVDQWLYDQPLNVKIENNSWIIVNLQQIGFFRVKYDTVLLNRLVEVLQSTEFEKIHVANRAQILDDAFVLLDANTSFAIAADYIIRETEYEPWFVMRKRITARVYDLWKNGQTAAYRDLEKRTLTLIYEAFPNGQVSNVTTHLQKLLHNLIIDFRSYIGDKTILKPAQAIYKDFLINEKIQDPNMRKIALCYGYKMSETPRADFEVLLRYYQKSVSAYVRKEVLSALGCSNDPKVLQMYLSEILSPNSRISRTHIKDVLKAVYNNHFNGLEVFLTFLDENIELLNEKYGKILNINGIIWESAQKVLTDEELLKVKKVIIKQQKISSKQEISAKALELLSRRIARKNDDF